MSSSIPVLSDISKVINPLKRYPHAQTGTGTALPVSETLASLQGHLEGNELEAADQLVAREQLEACADPEIQQHLAVLRMKQQRFADAEPLFARLAESNPNAVLQWNLARNLAAVQTHRPDLLRILLETAPCTTCQIIQLEGGLPSIVQTSAGAGQPQLLTPGGDPVAACRQYVEALSSSIDQGQCLALCGIGDGYFLAYLASHSPTFYRDRTHCLHLCEVHPEVIIQAFMIHDYSGEEGPIRHERFCWWVGPDWCNLLMNGLKADPFLPYPEQFVKLSLMHRRMESQMSRMADGLMAWEEKMLADLHADYAKRPNSEWVDVLGTNPSRPPRAMFITTRFSTVLQYSTRDIVDALNQEGWDTHLVIESAQHHVFGNRILLQAILDFQPDVIIQIDHLRQEWPDLLPPELPFVCWIQDDLPGLTQRKVGAQLHHRDFILTCAQPTYTNNYGYPARQCIYVDKLTRPVRRDSVVSAGLGSPDLVFVSNATQKPLDLVPGILDYATEFPEIVEVVEAVCHEMIAIYARGGTIYTLREIRALLDEEGLRRGGSWKSTELRDNLAIQLSGRFNNALYRQQSLDWIIEVAERLELSLELYGQGWEDNPKYARFAKGYIQYGPPLEELTRRAKINLQIVPYNCLHQRLLDGLTAGGFFLIREHPLDLHAAEFADFMSQHITPAMHSVEDAKRMLSSDLWDSFARLHERNSLLAEHAGVDLVEAWQRFVQDNLTFMIAGLPQRAAVSFSDAQTLEERIRHYLERKDRRAEVQTIQRDFVEANLTYRGGFRRIMKAIGRLISAEEEDNLAFKPGVPARVSTADGSRP